MTITNNIQNIVEKNIRTVAGLLVGGMFAASFLLPGATFADELARPAAEGQAASSITSVGMEFPNVDNYDSLLPRVKSVTDLEFPSVDDYDTLAPRIKSVTNLEFPAVDDYDTPAPRVKSVTNLEFPDMDDSIAHSVKTVTNLEFPDMDDSLAMTITVLEFPSQDETI